MKFDDPALTEELHDRGVDILTEIVESAEHDENTGEVILWGKWGPDYTTAAERFDQLEDVAYFLENFGWSIDSRGGSRVNSHIHFKPFGSRQLISRAEVMAILEAHPLHLSVQEDDEDQRLYSVRETVQPAQMEVVKVEFASANMELLAYLKRHPNLLHTISPRQLEEVVADILKNRGFEDVELTKQTRDGGYDIRALRKDGVGTLLYLVECKRYAPHNPVGVDLVRALYGTVTDAGASHGVMATTSYFSPDAKELADRIKYRMSLHAYDDLTKWIAELPSRK